MKRYWWWAAAAASVLLLAMLVRPPMQPRSVSPNQITQREIGSKNTTPPGTTVRGGDVRVPGRALPPGPTVTNTQVDTDRRVRDAADSVDGVREAWAVVTTPAGGWLTATGGNRIALVGVSLENSIKGSARTATLNEVATAVRDVPGIDKVSVTDSPTTVSRIKGIYEGLVSGKATTLFSNDLKRVTTELLQKAR